MWDTTDLDAKHFREKTLMTEATITAPAPAAEPVSAPAPAPAPSIPTPTTSVDPGKFPIREDYAAALLTEKLGAIPPDPEEAPVASIDETVEVAEPSEPSETPVEVSTTAAEEDFQLE